MYLPYRNNVNIYLVDSSSTNTSYIIIKKLRGFMRPSTPKGQQEEDIKGETIVSVNSSLSV